MSQKQRTWIEWIAWLAVEDHCEWANPYVARLRTPLGVLLLGALAALLCGLFVAPQGYAILAAILAVVLLGLVWPRIAMRGIRGRLSFAAARGRQGKPITATFVVENRWPWPVWGLAITDPLLEAAAGAEPEAAVALARIDGWSRATFHYTLTPAMRGEYPRTEVRIGSGFPFGLCRAAREVEVDRRLLVWPATFWLPPLEGRSWSHDWRGAATERCVGSQGTRLGPREHRHGDSLRDVHWSKSARYDRLIVSEREAASVENHAVVVDTDPASHRGAGADSTLERSLSIAASICETAVGQQASVTLWLGGDPVRAASPGADLEQLLDAVARFDAAAPRRGDERRLRRGLAGSTAVVSVGSETTSTRPGRFICVGECDRSSRSVADAWIIVDSPEDVAGQVLRGWRADPRRSGRAV